MMAMQERGHCQHYRDDDVISTRNVYLVVWLFLTFSSTSKSADSVLNQTDCKNSLVTNKPSFLCLSMKDIYITSRSMCLNPSDRLIIKGFFLHIPKENTTLSCPSEISSFYYTGSMNSSCLRTFNRELVGKMMLSIMEELSNKTNSEVNSSLIVQDFNNSKFFGLPQHTQLSLEVKCYSRENGNETFFDICDNRNNTDLEKFYLGFSMMNYNNNISSSECSCVIKSVEENNSSPIEIRAVDLRLAGGATLTLSDDTNQKTLSSPEPYWWEDILLSSQRDILIKLARLNPTKLPHSVWLEVTGGKNLTLSCSNSKRGNMDWTDVGDDNPFTIFLAVGIVVAVTLIIIVLVIFLWRQHVCKRVHREYVVVNSTNTVHEVMNVSAPDTETQHKDESTDTVSNVYFEVEPDSQNTQAPDSSIRRFQVVDDQDTTYLNVTMGTSRHENIYSHLREDTTMNPPVADLYDTAHCDVYSRLQRKKPKTVIDNTYNM